MKGLTGSAVHYVMRFSGKISDTFILKMTFYLELADTACVYSGKN